MIGNTMFRAHLHFLSTLLICVSALATGFVKKLKNNTDCFNRAAGYKTVNSRIINMTLVDPYKDICSLGSDQMTVIEIGPLQNSQYPYKDVYICWPRQLSHGTLIFNGAVLTTKPNVSKTTTCEPHDSIVIHNRPNSPVYTLLRTFDMTTVEAKFSPFVQYGTKKPVSHLKNNTDTIERIRRQIIDHPSYSKQSAITDASECGNKRGCFRKGKRSCQHLECDYFLSYRYMKDNENVDIEISAKTKGWVAVGFSSDRTMGGDEIFACMYKRQNTPPIRAASFENPHPHMRPTEIEYLTVQYSVSKNGYLFCRFEVPVKRKDHTVDLTNEWIQFYAIGGMAGQIMEKHETTPMMSARHISIVEHMNIISSASILSPTTMVIMLLLVTV